MEWSPFTVASGLYVLLFVFAMSSHPEWFDFSENNDVNTTTKCFTAFFVAGIMAVIIYYLTVMFA